MKLSKRYRFLIVQAKLEAEQHRCDGAAIKFLMATLNIPHKKAVMLWFNHTAMPQVKRNAIYREIVNNLPRYRGMIDRQDRSIVVFGKSCKIFDY